MILLDTHVALWWLDNSSRLGEEARDDIARADIAYVSVVSAWEGAINISAGKLRTPGPFEAAIDASGFSKLPLTFTHAAALARATGSSQGSIRSHADRAGARGRPHARDGGP